MEKNISLSLSRLGLFQVLRQVVETAAGADLRIKSLKGEGGSGGITVKRDFSSRMLKLDLQQIIQCIDPFWSVNWDCWLGASKADNWELQ